MKKLFAFLIPCLLLSGCAAPALGGAEIPVEILGSLDEATRRELVEEPKYVALTFDDGPRASTTSRLLDGLLERGVSATFFVIGQQIPGNEELLRRMAAEGHQIGNHTYSHVKLLKSEKDVVVQEIQKTEVLLRGAVGEGSFWLRPPYGQVTAGTEASFGVPMVKWSVDPRDWESRNTEKVTQAILDYAEPNSIILLHDIYPTSVDAALKVVDALQEEGYWFVTVEELFRIQGVEPQAGKLYARPDRVRELN